MPIKRRLKSWRDTSHFKNIRASRLDRSFKAMMERKKIKAYYKKNKAKIKQKAKKRRQLRTPSEKKFDKNRSEFLKEYEPKLPPRPGQKKKSEVIKKVQKKVKHVKHKVAKVFHKAIKTIKKAKNAIKKPKSAVKKVKQAYKKSKPSKRTGVRAK